MSGPVETSARDGEAGTVLLSTLLMLSLISAVALALLATLRLSVTRAQTLSEMSQADLYARGAEDFATAQLGRLAGLEGPALNAQLLALDAEPVILPYEGGAMQLSVRDGTHCLRLSGLVDAAGIAQDAEVARLQALMETLGVPAGQARQIAAAAADWVDADSQARPGGAEDGAYLLRRPAHRTANVPFASVAELRAVDGMDEAVFQTLRPHLCIGETGAPSRFNLDTAQAQHLPVLAALLGASSGDAPATALQTAVRLLEGRPAAGFESFAAADALLPPGADGGPQALDRTAFQFAPDRIEVEAVVRFGETERARLFGFEGLDSGRPRLSYRDWGREVLRPVPTVAQAPGTQGTPRDR